MNYHRVEKRKSPKRFGWSLLILIVALMVIYFFGSTLNKWLYPPIEIISRPFLSISQSVENLFSQSTKFFVFKSNLIAENKKLQSENIRLKNLWLANRQVEQENVELKKIAGLRNVKKAPILVEVLAKPIFTPHDILLIDWGTNSSDKIKIGNKVGLSGGTVLLGEISEVFGQSAKVKLYSTFGSQIAVSVGPNHIPGIASGQGSGNFLLSLPRGTEVNIGDSVVASSYHDLLLGSVGAIQSVSSNPYIKVLFRSPINVYELKWVEVYD